MGITAEEFRKGTVSKKRYEEEKREGHIKDSKENIEKIKRQIETDKKLPKWKKQKLLRTVNKTIEIFKLSDTFRRCIELTQKKYPDMSKEEAADRCTIKHISKTDKEYKKWQKKMA